eukprot:749818-Hanusia_phi.AAC.6
MHEGISLLAHDLAIMLDDSLKHGGPSLLRVLAVKDQANAVVPNHMLCVAREQVVDGCIVLAGSKVENFQPSFQLRFHMYVSPLVLVPVTAVDDYHLLIHLAILVLASRYPSHEVDADVTLDVVISEYLQSPLGCRGFSNVVLGETTPHGRMSSFAPWLHIR